MKEWHFKEKVYRTWVVVVEGSADEFRQFLKDATYTEEFEGGNSGACIHLNEENTTNGNDCYVIWLKKWESACFTHELVHLAMMIFDAKHVPIHIENTEGLAYYVEFWFNEITRTRRHHPAGRAAKEVRKLK